MADSQELRELVRRSTDGDREAFDELVRRYRSRIESLVHLRIGKSLRRRVGVQDAVQETFLRAFRAIGDFEWQGDRQFLTWLCTTAERTCTDAVRRHVLAEKKSIRREVPLDAPAGGSDENVALIQLLSSTQTGPSRFVRREERLERLESAMDELPPRYREVLLLSVVQRIPTQEVARRLSLTSAAVCMLRTRALRKLRDIFGETESLRLPDRPVFERPADSV